MPGWGSTTVRLAPTCTEQGYTTYTCKCGHSYQDAFIAAPGHDWLEATCLESKACKRCGLEEGEALGHSFNQWRVLHRPSCTSEGQRIRVCDCGAEEIETIPVEAHRYENGTCRICGAADAEYVHGDVTGDGKADYTDALLILRASIGLEELTEEQKLLADVTGDGQYNYGDALLILRRSIGLE